MEVAGSDINQKTLCTKGRRKTRARIHTPKSYSNLMQVVWRGGGHGMVDRHTISAPEGMKSMYMHIILCSLSLSVAVLVRRARAKRGNLRTKERRKRRAMPRQEHQTREGAQRTGCFVFDFRFSCACDRAVVPCHFDGFRIRLDFIEGSAIYSRPAERLQVIVSRGHCVCCCDGVFKCVQ